MLCCACLGARAPALVWLRPPAGAGPAAARRKIGIVLGDGSDACAGAAGVAPVVGLVAVGPVDVGPAAVAPAEAAAPGPGAGTALPIRAATASASCSSESLGWLTLPSLRVRPCHAWTT